MLLGTYINTITLCQDTVDMCRVIKRVIPEFDVVVAIPRGGFTPASIIASIFGKPLTTPDMLLNGRWWWTTSCYVEKPRDSRVDYFDMPIEFKDDYKVLLVDDVSYNWYGLLHRTKEMLMQQRPKYTVYKVAVYCFERTKRNLDFYCKQISIEHWFEKDLMVRKRGSAPLLLDMDGVICEDCPDYIVQSEERYLQWLVDVKPYLLPHWIVDYIVTGRLEKYRPQTEDWLKRHGVKYRHLIMQDNSNPLGNPRINTDHALFKVNVVRGLSLPDGSIFIESNRDQAITIFKMTGVQTVCTSTNELIGAADSGYNYHPAFEGYKRNVPHPLIVAPKEGIAEPSQPSRKPSRLFPFW